MQCSTLLPLLLLIFSNWKGEASSSPRTLKLCLYLKAIRRSTAECDQVTLDNLTSVEENQPNSTMSPLAKIIANIEKRNEKVKMTKKFKKFGVPLPMCSSNLESGYKQCRMDITCSSGYSCENNSKTRCCMEANHSPEIERKTEEFKTCPSQLQMAYFCQKTSTARKTVKPCKTDQDCMFSNVQKCCDAGCGFNVCVVASGNYTQNTLIFLGSK
ncbi:WAP domain-containing protein [Caenorhabditis elegans]|uniref:WAP domain-containing protein n=1 Tax=Caenorhabditis elegans TaxID=6239 RepID=Q23053_CAEEL|nr:WAP domain-containing protein [Caenorhabditis elegans]CCD65665.1 WAP domain-containing protein [Caenorhabditis elegans]|eukprot:NP_505351.2 Uncharacterized protein CELE_T27E4.5 [Caenorhabditis elegans]